MPLVDPQPADITSASTLNMAKSIRIDLISAS
jgi:hypothetical protein